MRAPDCGLSQAEVMLRGQELNSTLCCRDAAKYRNSKAKTVSKKAHRIGKVGAQSSK